jgi:hypothetical protein
MCSRRFRPACGNTPAVCAPNACPQAGVPGVRGTALGFDGTSGLVIPDAPQLRLGAFTVGLWVRPTQAPGAPAALVTRDEGSAGSRRNYGLHLFPGTMQVEASMHNAACTVFTSVRSTRGLPLDRWTHVLMTSDGQRLRLFLDGALEAQADAGGVCQSAAPVQIGRQNGVAGGFVGQLDELMIHGEALTSAEVRALVLGTARAAHWTLDEGTGATGFADISGSGRNASCALAACPTAGGSGMDGGAIALNGMNQSLSAPLGTSTAGDVSLAAWVRWDGVSRTWQPILYNGDTGASGYGLYLINGVPSLLVGGVAVGVAGAPLPANTWQHLALVRGNGVWTLYLNGTPQPLTNATAAPNAPRPGDRTLIGTDSIDTGFFGGQLDEAAIYERALGTAEVGLLATPTGALRHWRLDETGAATSFADAGNAPHAATCTACPTAVAGRAQGALLFDGVDDMLATPAAGLPSGAQSLSMFAWVKTSRAARQTIASYGSAAPSRTVALVTGQVAADGMFGVDFYGNYVASGQLLSDDAWHHVGFSYDGGASVTLFVDGVAFPRTLPAGALDIAAGSTFHIGRWVSSGAGDTQPYPFAGTLDDVRVYGRAMSPAEARTLFDSTTGPQRPLAGHWDMDDARSAPLAGSSSLLLDGTSDINAGADERLRVGDEATLAAWIYPTGPGGHAAYGGMIVSKEGEYELTRYPDGTLRAAFANTTPGWSSVNTGVVAPLHRWSHVAVTYSATTGRMTTYLNGRPLNVVAVAGPIGDAAPGQNELRIGGRQAWAQGFAGMLDDVRVYPRALGAAEMLALAQNGWRQLALAQPRAQQFSIAAATPAAGQLSWNASVPAGLEGNYLVDTRASDMFGQVSPVGRVTNMRSLGVDTLPPRVSLTRELIGTDSSAQTRYTLAAEDFNLLADEVRAPCPARAFGRETYTAPWFLAAVGRTALDAARVHRVSATCVVPGHQTVLAEVVARDAYGNIGVATIPALTASTATVAVAVLTPADWSVITTPGALDIDVAVQTGAAVDSVTITIDGVQTLTAAPQGSVWRAAWTPAADGRHTVVATAVAGGVSYTSATTTVTLDTQAPAVTLATNAIGAAQLDRAGFATLSGTVVDGGGVERVMVEIGGGRPATLNATVEGGTWRASWFLGDSTFDGVSVPMTVTARDSAGLTGSVAGTVVVDLVAAPPVEIAISQGGRAVQPGQVLTSTTELLVAAAGPGGSPPPGTSYEWQITRGVSNTLVVVGDRVTPQELDTLIARVTQTDAAGNTRVQSAAPLFVDTPYTPDRITLSGPEGIATGWMATGCTDLGVDRRAAQLGRAGARDVPQQLYASWDEHALRLAWTGADWNRDGDLFVYLDTRAGGAERLYDPFAATQPNTAIFQPARQNGASVDRMLADYLVWVRGNGDAALLMWDGSAWQTSAAPFGLRYSGGASARTDLELPFATLGIANPAAASLGLVALASEEQALRLWAALPARNPLDSPRATLSRPDTALHRFSLSERYRWTSLGSGLCPNGTLAPAAGGVAGPRNTLLDAAISVSGGGAAYRVVGDDLFFAQNDLLPGLADWTAAGATFCSANPADAECARRAAPRDPGEGAAVAPYTADDSSALPSTGAALSHGQLLTYTLRLANTGRIAVSGVTAQATTRGQLRLTSAGATPAGPGEALALGPWDIAAGETRTVLVTGVVDITRDPAHRGYASLDVSIADADGGTWDWLAADHRVDAQPVAATLALDEPSLRVGTNLVSGNVTGGDSAEIEIEAQRLAGTVWGGAGSYTCPDPSPGDGFWACTLALNGAAHGQVYRLRARAVDLAGRVGPWSAWQLARVDAEGPVVAFDDVVRDVLADGLLAPGANGSILLSGTANDDQQIAAVEVCETVAGQEVCGLAEVQVSPTTAARPAVVVEDTPAAPVAIDGGARCGTGAGMAGGTPVERTFVIDDDITISALQVGLAIQHPFRADLDAQLVSPAGTRAHLLWGGTAAANYDVLLADVGTRNRDDHSTHDTGAPFFDSVMQADSPLSVFAGEPARGTWTLRMCDVAPGADDGAYLRGRLVITPQHIPGGSTATWRYTSRAGAEDNVQHSIRVTARDERNNLSAAPLRATYRVDTIGPRIEVLELPANVTVLDDSVVLRGTVRDGGTVRALQVTLTRPGGIVETAPATIAPDGGWAYRLPLAGAGRHTIFLTAFDAAGNRSSAGPLGVNVVCLNSVPRVSGLQLLGSAGNAVLQAQVHNDGADTLPAGLPLTFFADGVEVGATRLEQALAPGASAVVQLAWPEAPAGTLALEVVGNSGQSGRLPLCATPERVVTEQRLGRVWQLFLPRIGR